MVASASPIPPIDLARMAAEQLRDPKVAELRKQPGALKLKEVNLGGYNLLCDVSTSRPRPIALDKDKKCLAVGFFMNAAELSKDGEFMTLTSRKQVSIHPSSSLFQHKPACVVYTELVKTSKTYMRTLSVVDPDWLFEAAPAYFRRKRASAIT
ncbi:pre-mRNA-splicing factor ATP-dependent RNA helicase deah10 [Plakobranchus ocellatus]|uniref:Pre-mRNA-splicing factor ATP-dependent RNA helicase deah10 n=1 Tax=Plakobranchus ocellatus TaxID=259542 RepID=A0AAV3YLY3_9GAST|nr:pre-mRNA-splicing factor ATP-dependent RNA helicase deah10 [Plakobranchus ocellatus]